MFKYVCVFICVIKTGRSLNVRQANEHETKHPLPTSICIWYTRQLHQYRNETAITFWLYYNEAYGWPDTGYCKNACVLTPDFLPSVREKTNTHTHAKSTSVVQESTTVNKHDMKKWQKENKKNCSWKNKLTPSGSFFSLAIVVSYC